MGGAPSKPGDPSTPMQIIGAGYSRTGTTSTYMALEKLLQGPVLHGGTHMLSREDAYNKKWVLAYHAREAGDKATTLKLLRELTSGYVAVIDTPNWDFIPELVELYPEAKVVLMTRDPDSWWKSIGMNFRYALPWYVPILMAPVPGLRWFPDIVRSWQKIALRQMAEAKGPGAPVDKDLLEIHNDMVKRSVPADRLLVTSVKEGWEPLCNFLGKPIPDTPFPRVNDAKEAEDVAKAIFAKCIAVWAVVLSTGGLCTYALATMRK